MGLSEIPAPPEVTPGFDLPQLRTRPPGPQSRTWLTRFTRRQAPMGPRPADAQGRIVQADVPEGSIVLSQGKGCNLIDVDSNRYVDLAAGFGSLLLGHQHESVKRAMELQSGRLMQGLGDVYPSDAKIGLMERLCRLHDDPRAQVILGQSGADAVTAALKTAVLATGRSGIVAFGSSYHGLSYGALSVTDLRGGYRTPFVDHLARDVRFVDYPSNQEEAERSLEQLRAQLEGGAVGALIIEPILGRGGVIVPPLGFLSSVQAVAREVGALVIADEIWTGLGRTGRWLAHQREPDFRPDLVCIGKGLGGGLPISACLGTHEAMAHWSQADEVVHTSTFAGAPFACTTALATLDTLSRGRWVEATAELGARWIPHLRTLLAGTAVREVRGEGLMVGFDVAGLPGGASALQRALLERGFVTSTGGGKRDVLVLTPPLIVTEDLLMAFEDSLRLCLSLLSGRAR